MDALGPSREGQEPTRTVSNSNQKLRYTKVRDAVAGGMASVNAEPFFYSFIEEHETSKYLMEPGDFLVRQVLSWKNNSKSTQDKRYIIAFMTYSRTNRVYYLHEYCFNTAQGLVSYHRDFHVSLDRFADKFIVNGVRLAHEHKIYHEQIQRIKALGDGAFGEVFKAYYRAGVFSRVPVAVKILVGATTEDSEALLKEALLMRSLKIHHPNVVDLVAIACYEQPLMLVLQLCQGALLDFVQPPDEKHPNKRCPPIAERIHWVCGAARGLAFLHEKQIIHRDVAARNALIGKDNEAKISDFGLSRAGSLHQETKLKKVPIRYLAVETLTKGIYSPRTDVWAFGVLMWEVFNDGKTPYEDIDDSKIKEIKAFVKGGGRMQPGDTFPAELWKLCQNCWQEDPNKRLTMAECAHVCGLQYSVSGGWITAKRYAIIQQPNWDLDAFRAVEAERMKIVMAERKADGLDVPAPEAAAPPPPKARPSD
ncbi:unnamed protein product, partial [Mesorhabditis spiculigera]